MRAFIIVTLKEESKKINYDMELPTDVPVVQLVRDIAEAINLYNQRTLMPERNSSLYCERLGQTLPDGRTLGELGVWTGDILFLR